MMNPLSDVHVAALSALCSYDDKSLACSSRVVGLPNEAADGCFR